MPLWAGGAQQPFRFTPVLRSPPALPSAPKVPLLGPVSGYATGTGAFLLF